jgi:D,D-heptose 1,7-bisphosphate phosphatase
VKKAIFLDKDGTLVPDIPYNIDPQLLSLNAFAGPALQLLNNAGFNFFVISNQSGVAKGYFDLAALDKVSKQINDLLYPFNVVIEQFYYCPHLPEGVIPEFSFRCECRKPQSGLFFQAAAEHNIDLSRSWMIGDILNDCEAGNNAGCKNILLDNGNETEWVLSPARKPTHIVKDLLQAASRILLFQTGNQMYEPGRMVEG